MAETSSSADAPTAAPISEAAFRALADCLEDCVYLTDRRGRYVAVNQNFATWVGRTAEAIIGRTPQDIWPSPFAEGEASDDLRTLQGECLDREEQRPLRGVMRAVRTTRRPVRGADGVAGVLGCFRDMSGEFTADAAGQSARQFVLVGRLAGGVAHDFNNLLTAVLGHLALLRGSATLDAQEQDLLGAAERAAAQAAGLSMDLLAFLRKESRGPQPLDLNAVVEQIANLLRRTIDRRIQIMVRVQPALPPVDAVSSQITQLLLNLCLNARDAMPRGGRLRVETAAESFDPERARFHPQRQSGSFVRLRVADTGDGMPPAVRARLFEPAFTTKPPGSGNGLGLTIVQHVVQEHRGWIECVSSVGQGTCFDVYFPLRASCRENGKAG